MARANELVSGSGVDGRPFEVRMFDRRGVLKLNQQPGLLPGVGVVVFPAESFDPLDPGRKALRTDGDIHIIARVDASRCTEPASTVPRPVIVKTSSTTKLNGPPEGT